MQGHVKTNGFSGSILLAREGKPLVSKGYGYANVEWQIPNTPQTKFRIGSITKQFTSMAVMQLREQGKLKLEDSVCALRRTLPRRVEAGHHPSPPDAYLRHPELYRAGGMAQGHDGAEDSRRDDRTSSAICRCSGRPERSTPTTTPATFFSARSSKKRRARSMRKCVREQIFTPLGMADSGYDWSATIIPRRASGYAGRPPARSQRRAARHAATVCRRLAVLHDRGPAEVGPGALHRPPASGRGETDDVDAVHEELRVRLDDRAAVAGDVRPSAPRARRRDQRLLEHDHPAAGHERHLHRADQHRRAARGGAGAVARDLLAIYYGQSYTMPAPRTVATVDPSIYDQYVGKYELAAGFIMTVTREGNSLITQADGSAERSRSFRSRRRNSFRR